MPFFNDSYRDDWPTLKMMSMDELNRYIDKIESAKRRAKLEKDKERYYRLLNYGLPVKLYRFKKRNQEAAVG